MFSSVFLHSFLELLALLLVTLFVRFLVRAHAYFLYSSRRKTDELQTRTSQSMSVDHERGTHASDRERVNEANEHMPTEWNEAVVGGPTRTAT
jgi:hypothetical protein